MHTIQTNNVQWMREDRQSSNNEIITTIIIIKTKYKSILEEETMIRPSKCSTISKRLINWWQMRWTTCTRHVYLSIIYWKVAHSQYTGLANPHVSNVETDVSYSAVTFFPTETAFPFFRFFKADDNVDNGSSRKHTIQKITNEGEEEEKNLLKKLFEGIL